MTVMSWLSFLLPRRKTSAQLAKQRLQGVLAQERHSRHPRRTPDYLPALQRELQMVVARHIKVAPREVAVRFAHPRHTPEGLEVRIELPQPAQA